MDVNLQITPNSLHAVMRPTLSLSPYDSIRRFLDLIRSQPDQVLPVVENGIFRGIVTLESAVARVLKETGTLRERALNRPVSEVMSHGETVVLSTMSLAEVETLFLTHKLSALPVIDTDGRLYGMICAADLFISEAPKPKPKSIGGMATPFGVYLTDGNIQAGAGNLALVASGMLLCVLSIVSFGLLDGAVWLLRRFGHVMTSSVFDLDYAPDPAHPGLAIGSITFKALGILIFFLLMRATRVAGYHAAEHQTVHALERGEMLHTDVVSRMPRAHPRCGTNLVAAMLVFTTLVEVLQYAPKAVGEFAALGAAITTIFSWRRVGTFLQEGFTTKPANDRELQSGIRAGDALMEKFTASPPRKVRFLRWIWCSGMPQTLLGYALTWSVFSFLMSLDR